MAQSQRIFRALFLVIVAFELVYSSKDLLITHLHPCTFENAFDSFSSITVDNCAKECNNRARCLSLSYNQYISHCVLREREYIASEVDSKKRKCVIVNRDEVIAEINNTTTNVKDSLIGHCANNTCDDLSECMDINDKISCIVRYCNSVTNISNAYYISPVATKVGNKNTLACDSNYTAFGKGSVTCTKHGTFEDAHFVCVQNCPSPPIKVGASIVTWSPRRFTENTTVTYTCTEGYYTFISPTIECKAGGQWSEFECTPACHHSNAPTVANGYLLPGDWYTVLDVGTYACSDGYYLSPGNPTIGCNATGVWDLPAVSCYKYCTHETLPGKPNAVTALGTLYDFTMSVEYGCVDGYYHAFGK